MINKNIIKKNSFRTLSLVSGIVIVGVIVTAAFPPQSIFRF